MIFQFAFSDLPTRNLHGLYGPYTYVTSSDGISRWRDCLASSELLVSRRWYNIAQRACLMNTTFDLCCLCLVNTRKPLVIREIRNTHLINRVQTTLCQCCAPVQTLGELLRACPNLSWLRLTKIPASLFDRQEYRIGRACKEQLSLSDLNGIPWLRILLQHRRLRKVTVEPDHTCGAGCPSRSSHSPCAYGHNMTRLKCYLWLQMLEVKHGLRRETVVEHVRKDWIAHGVWMEDVEALLSVLGEFYASQARDDDVPWVKAWAKALCPGKDGM